MKLLLYLLGVVIYDKLVWYYYLILIRVFDLGLGGLGGRVWFLDIDGMFGYGLLFVIWWYVMGCIVWWLVLVSNVRNDKCIC